MSVACSALGAAAAWRCQLGLSTYTVITERKLKSKVDDASFSQTVSDYENSIDLLSPDVGVIQFMKHGYSVRFDSVNYNANGLELTGTIGNPTQ
jgi:hypothetical protein